MPRFEEIIELKLNTIQERMEVHAKDTEVRHAEVMNIMKDHEARLRGLEKFKYMIMAGAGALGAAGHKIGAWLGFTQN